MKKISVFLSVIVLALGLSPMVAQADLLTDGDFEASAWSTFGNAFQDEVAPGIDPGFEGAQSLKMFGNFSGSTNFAGAFQDVAVDGVNLSHGDLVQLSGSLAHLGSDALSSDVQAFLEITFVDTDVLGEFGFGANTSASLLSTSPTDSWEFFTTAGVFVPVEAEFVRAKVVFIQQTSGGGASWTDNVQLVNLSAIPEPATASLLGLAGLAFFVRRRRI